MFIVIHIFESSCRILSTYLNMIYYWRVLNTLIFLAKDPYKDRKCYWFQSSDLSPLKYSWLHAFNIPAHTSVLLTQNYTVSIPTS